MRRRAPFFWISEGTRGGYRLTLRPVGFNASCIPYSPVVKHTYVWSILEIKILKLPLGRGKELKLASAEVKFNVVLRFRLLELYVGSTATTTKVLTVRSFAKGRGLHLRLLVAAPASAIELSLAQRRKNGIC